MRSFACRLSAAVGPAFLAVLLSAGVAAALTADAGPDQVVDENTQVTLDGSGSTPSDGLPILSYVWTQIGGPSVALEGANDVTATFTAPAVGPAGASLTFRLTVTDNGGASASDTVAITVNDVNQPPVANAGPDQSVNEGAAVTLNGSGSSDPDGTIVSYQWVQTAGPSVNLSSTAAVQSTFTAPAVGPAGATLTFQLTVTDNGGATDTDTVTITVNNVNQPPVLAPIGNKTVNEGVLLSFTVSATDPDGDPVTITTSTLPTGAAFDGTTFSWTPTFTQAGSYQVTFTATANGQTDTEAITITVNDVNRPPVLTAIPNQSVPEGQTVTVPLSATDPDGHALTLSATGLPAFCSLTDAGNGTGSIACSPDFGDAGNYSMTVTATDNGSPPRADSKSFTLSVGAVDRPPVLAPIGNKTVAEGQLLSFPVSATDPDGDAVTITTSTLPTGASLAGGTFTWTPTFTQAGSYPVTFTATANGLSDSETVTITVTNVNRAPVANAGLDQTVREGELVLLDGSNSFDPDEPEGFIASYRWVQTAGLEGGVLVEPESAVTEFRPPPVPPQGAAFVFELTVTDELGATGTDTVVVNVSFNLAPVADAGPDQEVIEGQIVFLDGSASFHPDAAGFIEFFSWAQVSGPEVVLIDRDSAQASFVTPAVAAGGASIELELMVTDDLGLVGTDRVRINVVYLNRPPTAGAGPDQTVEEGRTVTLSGSGSLDPEGGVLAYAWRQTQGPAVTLSNPASAATTFVAPSVEGSGAVLTFELTVTDDGGLTATDAVQVSVEDNGIAIEGFPGDAITVLGSTGEPIGLKVLTGGGLVALEAMDPLSLPPSASPPLDLPYGVFSLRLKVATPGQAVTLRVYLPEPAPEDYVWMKYSPASDWVDYSAVGALFVEGTDRRELLVTLVDGGIGDDDGTVNGVIVDPAGLGLPDPSSVPGDGTQAPGGGGSGMGGFCFIRSLMR